MHIHFIQHMPFEYPGSILDWCAEKNYSYNITKVYETTDFPSLDVFDMLVMMGGSMGIYEEDKYPWLKPEKTFIKSAIDANKKVLGICLGAQLIAEILGSTVKPHTLKEIGWWPVKKVNAHPLTAHLPESFTTFHWHGDTYSLPEGAIHLLKTPGCEQQGYVYNNHIAGLQFHMEVKEDLLDNMADDERSELVKATYVQSEEEIKDMALQHIKIQKSYVQGFMEAFAAL